MRLSRIWAWRAEKGDAERRHRAEATREPATELTARIWWGAAAEVRVSGPTQRRAT